MADKIAIIGMGNVGFHFTKAFSEENFEVYFWSRSKIDKELLNLVSSAIQLNEIKDIPQDIKLCIICTSEDAISAIAQELKGFKGIVVHSSGSVSIAELESLSNRVGVVYPLQTFSKTRKLDYSEIPVFLETKDREVYTELELIIKKVFPNISYLKSEERKFLHLAAVFANNFVNACVMAAKEVSEDNNVDFSLLKPLIKETLSKLESIDPENSQTGPAKRKNQKIIELQIDLLSDKKDLKEIYEKVSTYITNKFNK